MQNRPNIKTFDELYKTLQVLGETNTIEAKKYTHALGKSFIETVVAFSNELGIGGGYMLIGVEENKLTGNYSITGVSNSDKLQLKIINQCRQLASHEINAFVEAIEKPEGTAILVYIPEAKPYQKPVYVKKRGLEKGAYRRMGPANHLCSHEDLSDLFREKYERSYDTTAVKKATVDDFDPQAIEVYRHEVKTLRGNVPELAFNDLDLLKSLDATTIEDGITYPTVAGLLLFGKEKVIRTVFGENARIEYLLVQGNKWGGTDTSKPYTGLEVFKPLMLTFSYLLKLIMDDIPADFSLDKEGIRRVDVPIIPQRVVREGLCNALMHRDYSSVRSIQIIKYGNRIEFRNPGFSLKLQEEYNKPGSVPRNKIITKVFREVEYAEAKGTGHIIASEEMLKKNYCIPLVESSRADSRFVYTILPQQISSKHNEEWLSQFDHFKLNKAQKRALIVLRELGGITAFDYTVINDIDELTTYSHINKLRSLELLIKRGSGERAFYTPGNIFWSTIIPDQESKSETVNEQNNQFNILTFIPAELLSALTEGTLAHFGKICDEIQSLGKRPPIDTTKQYIMKACSIAPLTSQQLTKLFCRKSQFRFHMNFIKPMVEQGDLLLKFPETPSHKDQAYRANPQSRIIRPHNTNKQKQN